MDIKITAPVGSYESLIAAVKAKADSVYFGIEQLNMRARAANNFTLSDLNKIVSICKENNIKTYLTLNTVIYDHDLSLMRKICDEAKKARVDAIIASDMAVVLYANSIGMSVHCSTQLNICNTDAVKFYSKYADVIVLARELTLQQIEKICNEIKKDNITGPSGDLVKIEIFVHGALCVAISGKCYMSLVTSNSSANRGACLQNCRKSYKIIDEETGDELVVDNKYIMSPKDLCTISFLDRILKSGVSILKIEGRGKPPEYVYTVTKVYREAVNGYLNNEYTEDKINKWLEELKAVYNRGFWQGGYYLGKKLGEWSGEPGSKATKEKAFLGIANNYFVKSNIAEFTLQSGVLSLGDEILVTGSTTGIIQTEVSDLVVDETHVNSVEKGQTFTVPIKERVRKNDKLFLLKRRQ